MQLTIEECTPLYSRNDLLEYLPDEDTERDFYYLTNDLLLQNGYHHYEIPTMHLIQENVSTTQATEQRWYIGIGVGAASLVDKFQI